MGVKYRLCGIVDQDYDADNEKKMGIRRIVDQDEEKKMGICSIVEQSFEKKIVYVKQRKKDGCLMNSRLGLRQKTKKKKRKRKKISPPLVHR